jgi:hypothetical protein
VFPSLTNSHQLLADRDYRGHWEETRGRLWTLLPAQGWDAWGLLRGHVNSACSPHPYSFSFCKFRSDVIYATLSPDVFTSWDLPFCPKTMKPSTRCAWVLATAIMSQREVKVFFNVGQRIGIVLTLLLKLLLFFFWQYCSLNSGS